MGRPGVLLIQILIRWDDNGYWYVLRQPSFLVELGLCIDIIGRSKVLL